MNMKFLGPGAFRLFLALSVVVSHVSPGRFGIVAVMAFFILSGYWVTRMYVEKYDKQPNSVRALYLSRFLRIWPPFAIAIVIAMAMRALRGENVSVPQLQVLSLLGVASGVRDPLGISWSLDIEMQFYLLLPLLVVVARLKPPALLLTAGVFALSAFGWALGYLAKIETVLAYLPAFAAGMAIYLTNYKASARSAAISVLVFLAIGALLLSNTHTQGIVIQDPMRPRLVHLASLFWALALVPFVAWNVRNRGTALDRHFGDFSYSLYLTHAPVIDTAEYLFGADIAYPHSLLLIPVCIAVALVFYLIVDRSSERLRLRIMARVAPEGVAT